MLKKTNYMTKQQSLDAKEISKLCCLMKFGPINQNTLKVKQLHEFFCSSKFRLLILPRNLNPLPRHGSVRLLGVPSESFGVLIYPTCIEEYVLF